MRTFGDQSISASCFRCFILPLLEYCAPVWSTEMTERSEVRLSVATFLYVSNSSVVAKQHGILVTDAMSAVSAC